jgi:hypothetical protein
MLLWLFLFFTWRNAMSKLKKQQHVAMVSHTWRNVMSNKLKRKNNNILKWGVGKNITGCGSL